ncbi:copper homeostasis periplasmic binding protein CopC [Pseudomonas chlororaphis]|uniref:Copper resistance protein C n=1 Tax=Pseudomonas chlororaphis TaxID=587753 RepID=A0A1Q8EQP3_9PSED|nr:copper homeostasis periplasmic binding protein CopC [Pseudomonas chlororaphis]OLF54104.1 copper resistance protein CopC [Pseudomonas chlororaphis]
MSYLKHLALAVTFGAGLSLAGLAQAHPKLLASTPAEGARGAAPAKIELHFSESLTTQFSGARLLMTGMPGMQHAPMPVKASVAGGADPKSMVVTPAAPLSAGSYKVEWRAVSADTHPITGSLTFDVN